MMLDPEIRLDEDRAEVRFTRAWDTDAEDLWDAVTDPGRLARWFAEIVGTPRVGEEFAIRFDDGDVPHMTLRSCDPGVGYSFTWPMAQGPTEVEVEVHPEGPGRSRLVLTHRLLPREKAPEYGAGWAAYVAHLGDHLTGGEPEDWWAQFGAARTRLAERISGLGA